MQILDECTLKVVNETKEAVREREEEWTKFNWSEPGK
jgi:hypothetical protein